MSLPFPNSQSRSRDTGVRDALRPGLETASHHSGARAVPARSGPERTDGLNPFNAAPLSPALRPGTGRAPAAGARLSRRSNARLQRASEITLMPPLAATRKRPEGRAPALRFAALPFTPLPSRRRVPAGRTRCAVRRETTRGTAVAKSRLSHASQSSMFNVQCSTFNCENSRTPLPFNLNEWRQTAGPGLTAGEYSHQLFDAVHPGFPNWAFSVERWMLNVSHHSLPPSPRLSPSPTTATPDLPAL